MLIYGMGSAGLADDLTKEGIPTTEQEADTLIQQVLSSKPQLEEMIDNAQYQAKSKGYVETIAGFRRRLGTVNSNDKGLASRAMRQSFNAIVQGSGAYCTNNALIMADKLFQKFNLKSRIVMTVHDSIVTDVHPDEIYTVAKLMKIAFEHLPLPQLLDNPIGDLRVPEKYNLGNGYFRLPLSGEIEIGANYNDDIDYDEELVKKYVTPKDCCTWQYKRVQAKEVMNTALSDVADNLSEAELEAVKAKIQAQYDETIHQIEIDEKPYLVIDES